MKKKTIILVAILFSIIKVNFGQIEYDFSLINSIQVEVYSEFTKEMVLDEKNILKSKLAQISMTSSNNSMNKLLKSFKRKSSYSKSILTHSNIIIKLNYKGGYHAATIKISTVTGDIVLDDLRGNIEAKNVSQKTGEAIIKFLKKNDLLKHFDSFNLIGLTKKL